MLTVIFGLDTTPDTRFSPYVLTSLHIRHTYTRMSAIRDEDNVKKQIRQIEVLVKLSKFCVIVISHYAEVFGECLSVPNKVR